MFLSSVDDNRQERNRNRNRNKIETRMQCIRYTQSSYCIYINTSILDYEKKNDHSFEVHRERSIFLINMCIISLYKIELCTIILLCTYNYGILRQAKWLGNMKPFKLYIALYLIFYFLT
jgi:hypothetical protein